MEPWFTQGLHISQLKIKNNAFKILIDSNGIGRMRNKKNQLTCPFQLSNNNFLDIQFRHDKNKYSHGSPKSFISQLKKNNAFKLLMDSAGIGRRRNKKNQQKRRDLYHELFPGSMWSEGKNAEIHAASWALQHFQTQTSIHPSISQFFLFITSHPHPLWINFLRKMMSQWQ